MYRTPAIILCLVCASVLIGCSRPTTRRLQGLTEAQVIERLGEPDSRFAARIGDPFFGPRPAGLQPGEGFKSLNYRIGGDLYHVELVQPAVYERIVGKNPGDAPLYVLQMNHTPKGVVY